ncbi:siderophore biosynthesis protein [Yinghuangia sp. ASG 101]|uniref:IucA/IucC family protein n=1 Tax=Yinghuangia sp. ASG 101 TaxID=2896848 RepID=UPI001E3A76FF|nr:IucA/IucC family protein [Yinghuangia sp. ASG 101]UGQ13821.1 siderophore biosynthesis protein [Yinghuangia sp. ASG 101]
MSLSGQVPARVERPRPGSPTIPEQPDSDTPPIDTARAADHAAVEALLRCLVREHGIAVRDSPSVRVSLAGPSVDVSLLYRSPTGWHRFGPVTGPDGRPLDAPALARLLCADQHPDVAAEFAAHVADSVARTAGHLTARRDAAAAYIAAGGVPAHDDDPPDVEPAGPSPFLEAEQALVLGHPFHPTPHSRQGVADEEAKRFSPELRGRFPLHWFAADPDVVQLDEDLLGPLPAIFAALAGPTLERPPGTVVFPAHPWQARAAARRPGVRALLDAGLLHDLGPAGPAWSPTSSVRTLYRADAPVMLKTSLGAEIADSRRENLRSEMRRGLAVHRVLDAGLKRVLHGAHPGFDVVRDLGWLTLRVPGSTCESGLELVVRDNPFGPRDRVQCVAGLTAERPDLPGGRSLLGRTIHHLALHTGRPPAEVADTWLRRYLDVVVAPVLWLYAEYGLGLEAHQQNTLVVLDGDGWPIGGRYRGNQGYHFSAARGTPLAHWLPAEVREDAATWSTDAVVDERLGYCIGVNNMLGVVGTLGAQQLADEKKMLGRVRAFLARLRSEYRRFGQGSAAHAGELVTTLLDAPALRCKANLRTRVEGLASPAQSPTNRTVYVDIANPIAAA